jgi:hypothetical protein
MASAQRCCVRAGANTVRVMTMTRDQARRRAWMLFRSLEKVAERDPEQEVRGLAVPVLDACLQAFREHVPDDPIVLSIREVMSPEAVADGEPVRAVDAALVAGQLAIAIGPEREVGGFA